MKKRIVGLVIGMMGMLSSAHAASLHYKMDRHDGNWTAFHYVDSAQQTVSCFALSNDLALGFKANSQGMGLMLWDAKGQQEAGKDRQIAITVGKQHFLFQMKAMNKNMLMNRTYTQDMKHLLQTLSYAQTALVEYGNHSMAVVDLSGLPTILSQFQHCVEQNRF